MKIPMRLVRLGLDRPSLAGSVFMTLSFTAAGLDLTDLGLVLDSIDLVLEVLATPIMAVLDTVLTDLDTVVLVILMLIDVD